MVPPSPPRDHSWSPIFQDELLGVLLALAIAKSALSPGGGHDVWSVQLHLQELVRVPFDLVPGTPSASVFVRPQSAKQKNCEFNVSGTGIKLFDVVRMAVLFVAGGEMGCFKSHAALI